VTNLNLNNPEELNNTIALKQKEITLLKEENDYISSKLKELLREIHEVESKFND
jgi:FtsZ-binding cell division protein ZapB